MNKASIISTFLREDARSYGEPATDLLQRTARLGLRRRELSIQPLSAGWTAEPPGTFKSGAGPIFAIAEAMRLLETEADVVVIRGRDLLRSGYSKSERAAAMEVFPGTTLPEAYTALTRVFLLRHGLSEDEYRQWSRALEANCRRTAMARGLDIRPPGTADREVTSLLRLVDCADPRIDFEGELVLATAQACDRLGVIAKTQVATVATSDDADGPEHLPELASYANLHAVFERIAHAVDLHGRLESGHLALELYTCFPVVPLAFLFAAGWVDSLSAAVEFLDRFEVTVSGGMNFARAPWNNPALRALILTADVVSSRGGSGVVHGNGGLGGRQGICVLEASS